MKQFIVEKLRNFFPACPVEKAWVFGSYARGEETRKSDIDIMVRFNKDAHVSLFDYAGIMNDLEDLFHRKIDLVTEEGGIMKFAKDSIEHDEILVYERNDTG